MTKMYRTQSFIQNTSMKIKHNTFSLSQRIPAQHYNCSLPQAEPTVKFMSQHVYSVHSECL